MPLPKYIAQQFIKKRFRRWFVIVATLLVVGLLGSWLISVDAKHRYNELLSPVIYDRNGTQIKIAENAKGHYVLQLATLPDEFAKLLLIKEDRFYYYHLGINPISTLRALYNYLRTGQAGGSSTITQQLAKNLLGNETNRNLLNKLYETIYALGMEIGFSKNDLLLMYANSVYLGNQVQGFETASHAYFGKPLSSTTHSEKVVLLATLSYPSTRNPWQEAGLSYANDLNERLASAEAFFSPSVTAGYSFQSDSYFELQTAGITCPNSCYTTIDDELSKKIRGILKRHITSGWSRGIKNGAVVVIDPNTSELIALIGSRDPTGQMTGDQINMAIEPRPIGSTIKPFIYAKGFVDGLRPYSLVEDREYKYPIATGHSLYPKNYDGQYRGEITLHEALSNSLNVPSVKVLEFIGLENFYSFMSESLKFTPLQDWDSYQYGIALGGLEMDLLTLTHYFTLFPQRGIIAPLVVNTGGREESYLPPQSDIKQSNRILDEAYVELVHTIISDRFTGVNQFGLSSNLNLSIQGYGVKTGTSRDFHDSWVVGYTPDFVVGVWLGNSENKPLKQVSGQSGAGGVWHDVMEYLLATDYNRNTKFPLEHSEQLAIENNEEWILKGDRIEDHRYLLQTNNLILNPHEGDEFALLANTAIPLIARKPVVWSVNDRELGYGQEITFNPARSGIYEVFALDEEAHVRESLLIYVTSPQLP